MSWKQRWKWRRCVPSFSGSLVCSNEGGAWKWLSFAGPIKMIYDSLDTSAKMPSKREMWWLRGRHTNPWRGVRKQSSAAAFYVNKPVSSVLVVWRLQKEKCNVLGSRVTDRPTTSFLFLHIEILCFCYLAYCLAKDREANKSNYLLINPLEIRALFYFWVQHKILGSVWT